MSHHTACYARDAPFTCLPFVAQLFLFKAQWNWPFLAARARLSAIACSLVIPLELELDWGSSWGLGFSTSNRKRCTNNPKATIVVNNSLWYSIKSRCIYKSSAKFSSYLAHYFPAARKISSSSALVFCSAIIPTATKWFTCFGIG